MNEKNEARTCTDCAYHHASRDICTCSPWGASGIRRPSSGEPHLRNGGCDWWLKREVMYHSPIYFKAMDDPEVKAEEALLELTESICRLHGQYHGRYKLLYWLLEWTATKLIWR